MPPLNDITTACEIHGNRTAHMLICNVWAVLSQTTTRYSMTECYVAMFGDQKSEQLEHLQHLAEYAGNTDRQGDCLSSRANV